MPFFLAVLFKSIFSIFLAEAALYEISYRRIAHHTPAVDMWKYADFYRICSYCKVLISLND